MAEIRDEDRPRMLRATEAAMRVEDGLFDPGFIDRIAAESAVEKAVIIQRWGIGPSLIADVVSENEVAAPGLPDVESFAGASRSAVLAALVASITTSLSDDQFTRTALSQAIASPLTRQVWSGFLREELGQWSEILSNAGLGPRDPSERDRAAHAVTLVAGQCYSRILFGDAASPVPDDRIIELALSLLESEGD